jgi:hypothetical protein
MFADLEGKIMKTAGTAKRAPEKDKVAQSELPDVIKKLGYRAEKLKSGWVAYEILGDLDRDR